MKVNPMKTNDVSRSATAWNAIDASMGTSTLRALAWSDEEDSIAEPVPYAGEGDPRPQASTPRFQLPALLFGIAATAATIAAGGLVLTLTGTEAPAPVTAVRPAPPQVGQPSRPDNPEGVTPDGVSRSSQPVFAGSPAVDAAPRVASVPHSVTNSPQPETATNSPTARVTAESAPTPKTAIEQGVEAADAPAEDAPAEPAADPVPPADAPVPPVLPVPPLTPPVFNPPIVSVPPVAPELVPHPVGPPVFHVPDAPAAPITALPSGPVFRVPGAALNPEIAVPAGTTLRPLAPKLPVNSAPR